MDGKPIEGTFRAHQVPIDITVGTPNQEEHLKQIEEWLHSYHAEELFDENGTLIPELQELAPTGDRRLAATRTQTAASCCVTCVPPISSSMQWISRAPALSRSRI